MEHLPDGRPGLVDGCAQGHAIGCEPRQDRHDVERRKCVQPCQSRALEQLGMNRAQQAARCISLGQPSQPYSAEQAGSNSLQSSRWLTSARTGIAGIAGLLQHSADSEISALQGLTCGGLIQKQDGWLGHQSAGDGQPPLLASRETPHADAPWQQTSHLQSPRCDAAMQ